MSAAEAVATAPGKILLAGEYAVLEGATAVVMAVGRRARATIAPRAGLAPPSPFLRAAAAALAAELGPDSAAARAALAVVVDTGALADRSGAKLGLGSSAAATVAALAACLVAGEVGTDSAELPPRTACRDPDSRASGGTPVGLDLVLLHRLAHAAHAEAQGALAARLAGGPAPRATRGSGADVAASVWGGVVELQPSDDERPPRVSALALPDGLALVPVWTGRPADTRLLVGEVAAFAAREPAAHRVCLAALSSGAAALAAACRAGDAAAAVAAIAAGGDAVRELGRAASAPLYLEEHRALAEAARARGGALKPTGAGGGDVALAAFDRLDGAEEFRAHVVTLGMTALDLRVDPRGAAREEDDA